MNEDRDGALLEVRADTAAFASDIAAMRESLVAGLGTAAGQAGARIEDALARSIRSGKLGFEDLKRTALAVMAEIAAASVRSGIGALLGGSGGGGVGGGLVSLALSALGLPGRATGGPVTAGRPYLVGERGAELFVPGTAGQVMPMGGAGSGAARDVRVAITLVAPQGSEAQALGRSSRQVARAVRAALEAAEG